MEKRPVVLSLINKGTPDHPRFLISDQFMRFYDGEAWTENEEKGLLYADSNEACKEMQRLLAVDYEGLPVRRFRAPIYLDLYAASDIPIHEVASWLVRVARLLIDSPKFGNGPVEGALGLTHIDWTELEEIRP